MYVNVGRTYRPGLPMARFPVLSWCWWCVVAVCWHGSVVSLAQQAQQGVADQDVRRYTQASVLGRVDVHAGELVTADDLESWRNAEPRSSEPTAFKYDCVKDARVLVRTRDESACICNAESAEALVRLRHASTKGAGLASALQSTQCLVTFRCGDNSTAKVVTAVCAVDSGMQNMDVTLKHSGTKLPLQVDLFAFDSKRRRVELFAAVRGGGSGTASASIYAKAAYQVSTSRAIENQDVLWQLATRAAETTTLGGIVNTLGAPFANFHARFSLPRVTSNSAKPLDSVVVFSFVAKMSIQRHIVAAALAFHDDDLEMDIYATGQVDGDGRLNAYEVRRVKGALTLRELAGGKSEGELYGLDYDVCGTGWDGAAKEPVYLTLRGGGLDSTAEGQVQLSCSGFQQPPVPFSEATFVAHVMRVPSRLIENVCCLGGEDVVLGRTTLNYADAYARTDLMSSSGAKQVLQVQGRKTIRENSFLVFSSVCVVNDEIAFKAPSFRSTNALPISELVAVVNDDIDALINAAIPYNGSSRNRTSLLANFEIAPSQDGSKTVLRLNGNFEGGAGSFTSTTTLKAGSCQSVESFEGSWTTASGDKVTFDATGDLCHVTESSAGSSSYVRGDAHAMAWAPALSTSNAWIGVASAVCDEASTPQAYLIDATAAKSGTEVEVSAGVASLKSQKVVASLRTDAKAAMIHTTNEWTSQRVDNPPNGHFKVAFEDASDAPTVVVASPTLAIGLESMAEHSQRAVHFVDSTLRLISARGQLNDVMVAALPNASSLYDFIHAIGFRNDESSCTIDVGTALRSVTCAGKIASRLSDDLGADGGMYNTLLGKSASIVSDFIEGDDTTAPIAMIGIAAEDDAAAAVLAKLDHKVAALIEDEVFVESSSIIMASSAGTFMNINPGLDELKSVRETSPVAGSTDGLLSPRSSGRGTRIPKAGLYFAGRLDRTRGMLLAISEMNTEFTRRLLDQIFSSRSGRSRIGLASLDSLIAADAVSDSRMQYTTKLRGKLVWPDVGLILSEGYLVQDVNGKTYTRRLLLRGRYVFEFGHALPIAFRTVRGGGAAEDINIAWLRAEGDLELRIDDVTGKPYAGGLLKFTKLGKEADPDSLFLSPAIKFREGTVGIRTEFQTPYLGCFGIAVSSSWSMLPRDDDTPVEEHYRHELKIHMAVHRPEDYNRVVDAFVIEATIANVTALELMEPFVHIASTYNYTSQSRALLESAFIVGATVVINELNGDVAMRKRRGHSDEFGAASDTSADLLKEGCIVPPDGPSAIRIQEIEIAGLHLFNADGSDMTLRLDLSSAGPGSYERKITPSPQHVVVAKGDLNLQIPFIGSYHLAPIDAHAAFHSESREQGVRSHLTLSTENDNTLALQFSLDAMVTIHGVPWRTRVTHMSREDAASQFFPSTAIPESFEASMDPFVYFMALSFTLPGGVVRAGLVTSTDNIRDSEMRSHFGLQIDGHGNEEEVLETYQSEIDNVISRHWERVVSEIESGVHDGDFKRQLRKCRGHPLNFGACIAAAFHALKNSAKSDVKNLTPSSRRSLASHDAKSFPMSSADDVAHALEKAAKDLGAMPISSSAQVKHIRVSGVNACPMSKADIELEMLRTEQTRLARCRLTSKSPQQDCAQLNFNVMELQRNVSEHSESRWESYGASETPKVTADVLASVAGGVEKSMQIEIDNVYTESLAKSIFTAYLDDVHAAFANALSRHIKGSYRDALGTGGAESNACGRDHNVVNTGFPLRACSMYPPPASTDEAFSAWTGWDDIAGLLDLARAMQRDVMSEGGFTYPLTSLSDVEGIMHDSFSIAAVVVASTSTDKFPQQKSSTMVASLMQRLTDARLNDDLQTQQCGDDGICQGGEQAFTEYRMGDVNNGTNLNAFVATGLYQYAIVKAFSVLTSPPLWRNRTFLSDVGKAGHVEASAWGCVISLEHGLDSNDLAIAAQYGDKDSHNQTVNSALRIAARDLLGVSMADCGEPGKPIAVQPPPPASNASSSQTTAPEGGSRRRMLETVDGRAASVRKWPSVAWVALLGLCALALHHGTANAHGRLSPRHIFGFFILAMITLAAAIVPTSAQPSDLIQLAGNAIDVGVELAQDGSLTNQEISFTIPDVALGGLSTTEIVLTGTITFTPGSESDLSDATYQISASASDAFTIAYEGLFNLEVSGLSVTAEKTGAESATSWSFSGEAGGVDLSLELSDGALKSLTLEGSTTSTDGMPGLMNKFNGMFGDSFEMTEIGLNITDTDDDRAIDFTHVSVTAVVFGHDGSLMAELAGSPLEVERFNGTLQLNDDTTVTLGGSPFCRRGDSSIEGELTIALPGETTGQAMVLEMSAEAACSGQDVTSITMQATMDSTYSFELGIFSLDVQQVSLEFFYDYTNDSPSSLDLSGELGIASIPTSFHVQISSDSIYELSIGSKSSSDSVDWEDSVAQVSGAEGSAAIKQSIPSIFTSGALSVRYFNGKLTEHEDAGTMTTNYDLEIAFDVLGIAVSARIDASGSTDSDFAISELGINATSNSVEIRFLYSREDDQSTGEATFKLTQQLGGASLYISPFELKGSMVMDDDHFTLDFSTTDDITIGVLSSEIRLQDFEATYDSGTDSLSLHGSLADVFTTSVAAVLGLSDSSVFSMTQLTFSADHLSFSDLSHIGSLGSYVSKDFAHKDGAAAIDNFNFKDSFELGQYMIEMEIELFESIRAHVNMTYDKELGRMNSIDANITTEWMILGIQGDSMCGNDGNGGALSGFVELSNLPFGISAFRADVDVSFRCQQSADGQSHEVQSFAFTATCTSSLTLQFDAFSMSLTNPTVSYDSATGSISFRADIEESVPGSLELRFDYIHGEDVSGIELTLAVTNDINLDALFSSTMPTETKGTAQRGMSSSHSGDLGGDVKAATLRSGTFVQLAYIGNEEDGRTLRFAIVGDLNLYGADLRLIFIADDLTSESRRRVLLSVEVSAEASSLPDFLQSVVENAGGGGLNAQVLIANAAGEYVIPRIDENQVSEASVRRLVRRASEDDQATSETIDMQGIFMIKITPGSGSTDPFADLKSGDSPFAQGNFAPGLYVAIESFIPLEFSIYVSIEIDLTFGDETDDCATLTSIDNLQGGISVTTSISFFIASQWNIRIPQCDSSESPQPVPGKGPTNLDLYGKLDIILPQFQLRGTISLDAGDDGWNNPFDITTKLTIYQVSVSLGFSFVTPFLSYLQFHAIAQLDDIRGDVLLAVNALPPEAAFNIQLENVGVEHLISVLTSGATDGSSEDSGIFEDREGSNAFMFAGSYHAWFNGRTTAIDIGSGDDSISIKPGFGVVARDVHLFWDTISAREVDFVVEASGNGASIEMFADVDPIDIFGILQIRGRSAQNPVALLQVNATTQGGVLLCADGAMDLLGITFELTVFMMINSGGAGCRDRLLAKGVNLTSPEPPGGIAVPTNQGIYIDAAFRWGAVYARGVLSTNNYRIWESDAQLEFAFEIETTNDQDILLTLLQQCADALLSEVTKAVNHVVESATATIHRLTHEVDKAREALEETRREINNFITEAENRVNSLESNKQSELDAAHSNEAQCKWYQFWYCVAAGYHYAAYAVIEVARQVALAALETARQVINEALNVAQDVLQVALQALRLAEDAMRVLQTALDTVVSSVTASLDGTLDGLQNVIRISLFQVTARLGQQGRRMLSEQNATMKSYNASSAEDGSIDGFTPWHEASQAHDSASPLRRLLGVPGICGDCYGAGEEGQCCFTCDDVKKAYKDKGWGVPDGIDIDGNRWEHGIDQCCSCYGGLTCDAHNYFCWGCPENGAKLCDRFAVTGADGKHYITHDYIRQVLPNDQKCCRTCEDVRRVYEMRGWNFVPGYVRQCGGVPQPPSVNVDRNSKPPRTDPTAPAGVLTMTINLLNTGDRTFQLLIESLEPREIAVSIMSSLSELIIGYLMGNVNDDTKKTLELEEGSAAKRKRRQAETVNCTDPVEFNACYPDCCDDSNTYFTAQDSRDAKNRILGGGHDTHNKLATNGGELSQKELDRHSVDVLLSGRAIFHERNGGVPPYGVEDREKPRPKAKVHVTFKPGSKKDAESSAMGHRLRSVVQDEIDRSMVGLQSSQLQPEVTLSCHDGCDGRASNGLWRLEAGPLYFSDVPAAVDALVSRQGQTKIQHDLLGYGSRTPYVVEIAGGSAENLYQEMIGASTLMSDEQVIQLATSSKYDMQVCSMNESYALDVPLDSSSPSSQRGLDDGAVAGIAIACVVMVVALALVVAVVLNRNRIRRQKEDEEDDSQITRTTGMPVTHSFRFEESTEDVREEARGTPSLLRRTSSKAGDLVKTTRGEQGTVLEDAEAGSSELRVYFPARIETVDPNTVEVATEDR